MMILHREFSIEVLELIVSHAPPAVTNGDLSIRPKVGRDFVFGIFLLGPQAIQDQKLHGISKANSRNDSCISPATQASEIIRERLMGQWWRTLRRRSQKHPISWTRILALADRWLPPPRVLHPYPAVRFAASHPR